MKKHILLFKFLIFAGISLFLIFFGHQYFTMPDTWLYILITVLLLLAFLRLFEWWTWEESS